MYNFNKKQKIVLGILVGIVAGFICYYVYAKEDNASTQIDIENTIETQEDEENKSYSDDMIFVHMSGAVNKEGLIELKADSRIADAIDKAGGIRDDAYVNDINLAYKLEDGMKIHIFTKEEKEKEGEKEESDLSNLEDLTEKYVTTSSGVSTKLEESEGNSNANKSEKININTATQAQLETLPGIGPSTAIKIISYRKDNGKFSSVEDIRDVSGIGEAKFEKIKELICVK